MNKDIFVIDYGMGNLGSVQNMLEYLGAKVTISSNTSDIEDFSHIILPGVGHFAQAMNNLRDNGWIETLNNQRLKDKKILGICLGMQLLTEYSEEGDCKGLQWFEAQTKRFPTAIPPQKRIIPHMGWTSLRPKIEHPILHNIPEDNRFYFVHSFYVDSISDFSGKAALSTYENFPFTSVLAYKNIAGVQFHPEKSHRFGMQLFKNFMEWN